MNARGARAMKVGCSNVAVILTLVGIGPLVAGVVGVAKLTSYSEGVDYALLGQTVFGLTFGLLACGYRSCLYLHKEYGVFVRKVLGVVLRQDRFFYDEFDVMCVDVFTATSSQEGGYSHRYYEVKLVGASRSLELRDYIKSNSVTSKNSFGHIKSLAYSMKAISGLEVVFSNEVKEINPRLGDEAQDA